MKLTIERRLIDDLSYGLLLVVVRATTTAPDALHDDVIGELVLLQVVIHLCIAHCALGSRLVCTDRRIHSHWRNMLFCRERAKLLRIVLNTILSVVDRVASLHVLPTRGVSNVRACSAFLDQSGLVIQIAV